MKRGILFILTLIFSLSAAVAQTKFELNSPLKVTEGERFRIEFVLTNGKVENFAPPTFTGLNVLAGPVSSHGTFYNNVQGKVTEGTTFTYTYTVQAHSDVSKATISGTSLTTADGKAYRTRATSIEVGKGASEQQQKRGTNPGSSAKLDASSILMKMEVTKSSLYKGEAMVATLKIYTQVGIAGLEDVKMPAFNGFWKQELDIKNETPVRVTLNNRSYESYVLSRWLIYPQRAGILTIEPSTITAVAQVVVESSGSGSSIFDSFFGSGSSVEHVRRKMASPALNINVRDLPQPLAEGFSGGVGQFTLKSSIATNDVIANSGGTITVTFSGTGNLPLIDAPVIEFPPGFDKYDTKVTEKISNTIQGSTGSRTWEFPFIARAEGSYTIAGVNVSYFDPTSGSYKTLKTENFDIKVSKDENAGSSIGNIISGVTKEDLRILGQDIRFIHKEKLKLHNKGRLFLWSPIFYILLTAIIVAFIAAIILLKKQIRNRADVVRTKNRQASRVALRRLKGANSYLRANEKNGFYEEMLKALWGYMGDKLAITVSDLSKERLREEFTRRGVDSQQGEEFLQLIADCEMAQYSPIGSIPMEDAYSAALDLIGRLELK